LTVTGGPARLSTAAALGRSVKQGQTGRCGGVRPAGAAASGGPVRQRQLEDHTASGAAADLGRAVQGPVGSEGKLVRTGAVRSVERRHDVEGPSGRQLIHPPGEMDVAAQRAVEVAVGAWICGPKAPLQGKWYEPRNVSVSGGVNRKKWLRYV
jgi:hypothetical protein